jgi:CRISPR/Cas system CMR-associated protein Cmr1 (group 7 of RAMP superfamily)
MGMKKRSYIAPGQTLPLRLVINADEELASKARLSLAAACAFSGLGARSRRLAGAVSLRAQTPAPPFQGIPAPGAEDLAHWLKDLLSRALPNPSARRHHAPAEYCVARSDVFRAGVLKQTFGTWEEAADTVGRAYARFRQFDPPGSTTRRQPDYGVARAAITGSVVAAGATIRRAAFGLPIGFRFKSLPGKGIQATPANGDRRGSPLFLTLERLKGHQLAVVWSIFQSQVTADHKIKIGHLEMPAPDFSLIDEMLERDEWASHSVAP